MLLWLFLRNIIWGKLLLTTDEIWEKFSCKLLNFIRLKVQNTHDAEDLLQDVFLRIHTNLEKVHNMKKVESWIFQITRNVINDYYRSHVRIEEFSEDSVILSDDELEFLSDIKECMISLVENLPEIHRVPLQMVYLEDKKQIDIAGELGLSIPGTKSRIQRGRKVLKKTLKECCNVQELKDMGNCSCYSSEREHSF